MVTAPRHANGKSAVLAQRGLRQRAHAVPLPRGVRRRSRDRSATGKESCDRDIAKLCSGEGSSSEGAGCSGPPRVREPLRAARGWGSLSTNLQPKGGEMTGRRHCSSSRGGCRAPSVQGSHLRRRRQARRGCGCQSSRGSRACANSRTTFPARLVRASGSRAAASHACIVKTRPSS